MNLPLLGPDPSCTLCDLHSQARNVGIPTRHLPTSLPTSPTTPHVLFLGRNPGYFEDIGGECFVGKSGEILREGYIKPLRLDSLACILLSNVCRCYTTDDAPPSISRHIRPCFEAHTLSELRLLAPHCPTLYLVCLGEQSTSAVLRFLLGRKSTPQKEAFALNGHTFTTPEAYAKTTSLPLPTLTFTLISTYHPSAIYRAGQSSDGTALSRYIYAVDSHMALLHRLLTTASRPLSEPTIVPPFPPPRSP